MSLIRTIASLNKVEDSKAKPTTVLGKFMSNLLEGKLKDSKEGVTKK